MKLPDKAYQFCKWFLCIVVPAFITLLELIVAACGLDIPIDSIVQIIAGVATFLGVILGISNYNFYKEGE